MRRKDLFGADFGQKVDLTTSIRSILRNYPEGTAVLKELIQNADDAGARKIEFCLDSRQHGTKTVAAETLQQFQGPALVIHNDAVFTEQDFQSIQRIGDSLKNVFESRSKIGRFGIGFNAVYHFTDLPSFVSSRYLVLLDPQARFLPDINPSNPGKIVDWTNDSTVLSRFSDQFAPYRGHGGVNFNGNGYNGTVFRLPLRTEEQAECSLLSKRDLPLSEAKELLSQLQNEASSLLLFLRNIEEIQISIWQDDATDAPITISRFHIENITQSLRIMRSDNIDKSYYSIKSTKKNSEVVESDFALQIKCWNRDQSTGSPQEYVENWQICNQCGGGRASLMATNLDNHFMKLIPWAGVASLFSTTGISHQTALVNGSAYCFLSLPILTGLPVMVNGFFELSSNRRDVWQAGADMTGDGKLRAEWNVSLMCDVIAPCYVRLLIIARDEFGFTDRYQRLWPTLSAQTPWNAIEDSVLQMAKTHELLRSRNTWVKPCESTLLPIFQGVAEPDNDEGSKILGWCALACGEKFVNCMSYLQGVLIRSKSCDRLLHPAMLRDIIRSKPADVKIFISELLSSQQRRNVEFLISYVMSDLKLESLASSLVRNNSQQSISSTMLSALRELNGLAILPLCNQNVGLIRVLSEAENAAFYKLTSIDLGPMNVMRGLTNSNFDVNETIEKMMNSQQAVELDLSCANLYVIGDENEKRLFSRAANLFIDSSHFGSNERRLLENKIFQSVSNIRAVDTAILNELLALTLPPFCRVGVHNKLITAADFRANFPAMEYNEFIGSIWSYLHNNPSLITEVSSAFLILITTKGIYIPFSGSLGVLSCSFDVTRLPLNLLLIAEKVVYCVNNQYIPNLHTMPSQFWNRICPPTRYGILKSFSTNVERLNELGADERIFLRTYLSNIEPLTTLSQSEITMFRALPLFQTYGTPECDVGSVMSFIAPIVDEVATSKYKLLLNPESIPDDIFPPSFIRVNSPEDLALLKALEFSTISRRTFFSEYVLQESNILHLLHPSSFRHVVKVMLSEGDEILDCSLRSSAFIPCQNCDDNILYKPSDLYDPTEDELVAILDEKFFPCIDFHSDELLLLLRALGLKNKNILQWSDMATFAKAISLISESDREASHLKVIRGSNLLRYLHNNFALLSGIQENRSKMAGFTTALNLLNFKNVFAGKSLDESVRSANKEHIETILTTDWLPIVTERINIAMPWATNSEKDENFPIKITCPPKKARPFCDAWFCSAVFCISNETIFSPHLAKFFGWDRSIDLKVIAIQLREIATRFEFIATGDTHLESEIAAAIGDIAATIPQIYQRLNSANSLKLVDVRGILEQVPWIWIGDKFISIDKVAITMSVNARPYLYQLPQDLLVYRNLLSTFQIKKIFTARDYILVLQQAAYDHGLSGTDPTITDRVLEEDKLDLAINLVTLISGEAGVDPNIFTIFVPTFNGKLAISTTLINDDVPWLSGPEFSSVRLNCRLLHPKVSSLVAEKLGVKSLRLSKIEVTLSQSIFTVPDNMSVESFGQSESITSRLHSILDLYPDGLPVLSELIQNADDAGASVVRFVVDETSYSSESLMDPKMAALQGPSLLAFNDAIFTEADFRSLARIGQASKIEKLATTGRFGLGFSSTYHFTDTPSFVSGEHLVIFDPHCSFLPGANINQPGMRIKYTTNDLKSIFPDQFEPFTLFGCDCQTFFPGTLFRFPLRSSSLARKSEISTRIYSSSEVYETMEDFSSKLQNYLIFLRCVRKIEIYSYSYNQNVDGGRALTLLHSVESKTYNLLKSQEISLLRYFDRNETLQLSRDDFYNKLMNTPEDMLPTVSYHIVLSVVHHGLNRSLHHFSKSTNVISGHNLEYEFVICSGLRGGAARRMACDSSLRHFKLAPLGAVAYCIKRTIWPLSEDKDQSVKVELFPSIPGQAFCFLPLPICTKLPVHVNSYWELSSNRRDIWMGNDTSGDAKRRGDWNVALMADVIAPLFSRLFQAVGAVITEDPEVYSSQLLKMLPCSTPSSHWRTVADYFFPAIATLKFLYSEMDGGKLLAPNEAVVMESMVCDIESNKLAKILVSERLPVCVLSSDVMKSFLEYKIVFGEVTPSLIRSHCITTAKKRKVLHVIATIGELGDDSAIYLLKYCLCDIQEFDYSLLQGLPLVPLCNGSFASICEPTDPPIYLATSVERKLLDKVSHYLVESDEKLGLSVSKIFRNPIFHENTNIRPLSQVDVVYLLRQIVPGDWLASDVIRVSNYKAFVSSEWLCDLWKYILDSKSINLYIEMFPMLPVYDLSEVSASTGTGTIIKLKKSVPVLASMQMKAYLVSVFWDMGIYIFEPYSLQTYSFHQDIVNLLLPQSAEGYCEAFTKIDIDAVANVSAAWTFEQRISLRDFILDNIVSTETIISPNCLHLLQSLPIWQVYTCHFQKSIDEFHTNFRFKALSVETMRIATTRIDESLLDESFIQLRNERDRPLYQKLGISTEISLSKFNTEVFFPGVSDGKYSRNVIIKNAGELLRTLAELEVSQPGFAHTLAQSRIFLNSQDEFRCASEMFDPDVPTLQALLPSNMFPHSSLSRDAALLSVLRSLGLNSTLTLDSVLQAASEIQSIHQSILHNLDEITNYRMDTSECFNRAKNLISYIDLHIEELLNEADSTGLMAIKERNLTNMSARELPVGGAWGRDLRSINWIPCEVTNPLLHTVEGAALPWPSNIHKHPFASPSQCVSSQHIWMCSQSFRIPIVQSQHWMTKILLGWNRKLSGRTVSLQLINLMELSDAVLKHRDIRGDAIRSLNNLYQTTAYRCLELLSDCLEEETTVEISSWIKTLAGKPVIFVKDRFVEAARLAFNPHANMVMEPFLFIVPVNLVSYSKLLSLLGVKAAFEPRDLVFTISELYHFHLDQKSRMTLLNVELCVAILKQLVKLTVDSDTTDDCRTSETLSESTPEKAIESTVLNVDANSNQQHLGVVKKQTFRLNDLGPLFAPDNDGYLVPAQQLTFDDAAWISQALRNRGPSRSLQLAHKSFTAFEAQALGMKSLREQLFSGSEIVCPDPIAINKMIGGLDGLEDLFKDVLSMADGIFHSEEVHFIYDENEYPCESLMNPGLEAAQGAALTVFFSGPTTLNSETISKLLSSPSLLSELPCDNALPTLESELRIYPKCGKRLVSSFAITDCLQIISGREFVIIDPTGEYLLQDASTLGRGFETREKRRSPRAQRVNLIDVADHGNGSRDQSVLQRFPHQFSSFVALPPSFGLSESIRSGTPFQGILIRMPLRKKPSTISSNIFRKIDFMSGFCALKTLSECSLVFGSSLISVKTSHFSSDDSTLSLDMKMSLVTDPGLRLLRESMLTNLQWKRTGILSSMFSKPFIPSEVTYKLVLEIIMPSPSEHEHGYVQSVDDAPINDWLRWSKQQLIGAKKADNCLVISSEYLVISILGAGRCKDEASREPFTSFGLRPRVSIAYKVLNEAELAIISIAPNLGWICCGASPLVISGLPCLIEAPFLENVWDRSIPFIGSREIRPIGSTSFSNPNGRLRLSRAGTTAMLGHLDVQSWNVSLLQTAIEILIPKALVALSLGNAISNRESFYKYWPFQSRMVSEVQSISSLCTFYPAIVNQNLFLTKSGFSRCESVIFPINKLPIRVLSILEDVETIGLIPCEVTADILASKKVKLATLSSHLFRELLRSFHPTKFKDFLNKDYMESILPIIKFALSDLTELDTMADFDRRRKFKELCNCPIVPTINGISCFPSIERDRLYILSASMIAILPNLYSKIVHPAVLTHFPIFHDRVFQDALFLVPKSSALISEIARYILPLTWQMYPAVSCWAPAISDPIYIGRGNSCSIELSIFILWKEVLCKESKEHLMVLKDWPIVPTVCGNNRVLFSPKFISCILPSLPSAADDKRRQNLKRESSRLTSIINANSEKSLSAVVVTTGYESDWSWAATKPPSRLMVHAYPHPEPNSSASEDQQMLTNYISTHNEIAENEPLTILDEPAVEGNDQDSLGDGIVALLIKMRYPYLDASLFEEPPLALRDCTLMSPRKALHSLAVLSDPNAVVYKSPVDSNVNLVIVDSNILDFEALNSNDRRSLLIYIYEDHVASPLNTTEINELKSLKLFSTFNRANQKWSAISISECKNGVYWATSLTALTDYNIGETIVNSNINTDDPIILSDDVQLRPLYNFLGVEQLTPALGTRKFIIPALQQANQGPTRLDLMINLSQRWSEIVDDTALVTSLKSVEFIPSWNDHNGADFSVLHRADEFLSWQNEELLATLSSAYQTKYFPPPVIRNERMHKLMVDLGMATDISGDLVLQIATEIEKMIETSESSNSSCESIAIASECGRKLLRYIRDETRSAALFTRQFSAKLANIKFIPAQMPVRVEAGAFVVYESKLCSFSQLASKQCGALLFTVKPVLGDDITLLDFIYPRVSVTHDPSLDTIIKHVRNLTLNNDNLDRWNSNRFTLETTFRCIFNKLFDCWNDLSLSMKSELQILNLIPVGSQLVSSNRAFFKLSEDLAPFMYEISRSMGGQEAFFKLIGVLESPSIRDYSFFLQSLAVESNFGHLNPNELRAAISIVQTIAFSDESEVTKSSLQLLPIYIPDESSVLRERVKLVYNDDNFRKIRIGARLNSLELYFAHPLISLSVCESLSIPKLSHILQEDLSEGVAFNADLGIISNLSMQAQAIISSEDFLLGLFDLIVHSSKSNMMLSPAITLQLGSQSATLTSTAVFTVSSIKSFLTNFEIHFVKKLLTVFRLKSNNCPVVTQPAPTEVFVNYNDSNNLTYGGSIYVNAKFITPPVSVELALGIAVAEIFGMSLLNAPTIAILLETHNSKKFPSSILDMVHSGDELRTVKEGRTQSLLTTLRVGSDSLSMRERVRGNPGEIIQSSDDIMSIELKPFRLFRVGEIVAYQEVVPASTDLNRITVIYRYAKVINLVEPDDVGLRRLLLKVGPEKTVVVLSTEVFSFRSAKDTNVKSKQSSPWRILSNVTESLGAPISNEQSSTQANDVDCKNCSKQLEPVSQKELLDVISTLLYRAGLSQSLDSQSLTQQVLDLRTSLKNIESTLATERSQLYETKRHLDRSTAALQCQICLVSKVDRVLVPCGHIICSCCSEHFQRRQCPFCRQNYSQIVQFFAPEITVDNTFNI